jgi:hypothetical protein
MEENIKEAEITILTDTIKHVTVARACKEVITYGSSTAILRSIRNTRRMYPPSQRHLPDILCDTRVCHKPL